MADILLDVQGASTTPAAGQAVAFFESTQKQLTYKNDAGRTTTLGLGGIASYAIAPVTGYSSDTYLVGSAVTVPATLTLQAGSIYHCKVSLSKTGAGTATPICTLRVGTAGTTADTAVLVFTGAAQTGSADVGVINVFATWQSVGASGILQGTYALTHNLANAAGLAGTNVIEVTGSAFATTTASLILGLSLNFGASAVVTTTQVEAELLNV